MQKEELFLSLKTELEPYKKMLGTASDTIINKEVSSFPIIVVHRQSINLGILLTPESGHNNLLLSASSLEEFSAKQLIETDRIDNFKQIYKDPDSFLCLFVLENTGATFVFLPRN